MIDRKIWIEDVDGAKIMDSIELFGVKCINASFDDHFDFYQGQEQQYPRFGVAAWKYQKTNDWTVRIEWFGVRRIYLAAYGKTLDEAKEKVAKEFAEMMKGAKAISGRFM